MSDSPGNGPSEPRRPRVVDKRVSARTEDSPASPSTTPTDAAPSTSRAPSGPQEDPQPQQAQPQMTPEQEAEARRLMEHMTTTPSFDWVANTCVTLASLADAKLRTGNHTDARLPIDALAGILEKVGTQLGELEKPLRHTLSELQMAFATTTKETQ